MNAIYFCVTYIPICFLACYFLSKTAKIERVLFSNCALCLCVYSKRSDFEGKEKEISVSD